MTIRSQHLLGLLVACLAAGPATGQSEKDVQNCMRDLDWLGVRFEALAAEHDIEARIDGLCASGSRDEAAALQRAFDDELYAGPEGARARECATILAALISGRLADGSIEIDADADEHVCDADF